MQHIFRMYDWMYNSLCLWLDLQTSTVAWVASVIEHKVLYLQSDLLTSTYKLDYYKLGGCTNCRISGSSSTAVLSLDITWFTDLWAWICSTHWLMYEFQFQSSFASYFKHGKTIAFIVPEPFPQNKDLCMTRAKWF